MILLIDNYDSFVYNLARYIGELGYQRVVKRNDEISLEEIMVMKPSHIIISPGPCTPNEAGISMRVIRHFGPIVPILGVCLGHQAIGQVYGGVVKKAVKPVHGMTSAIYHNQNGLFSKIENPMIVARYHSLIVDIHNLSEELTIIATTESGEIMALQHKKYPIYGVQFHPESVLTLYGYQLLNNFLQQNLQSNVYRYSFLDKKENMLTN